MRIIQTYIPKGRNNRPGHPLSPKFITVHNTANTSKGANAAMHARYVKNPTTATSWHYTVDDNDIIYQHLPTNESGFHAGDGNGQGNRASIGIEICENVDGNFQKATENAVWLIRRLMKEFNIPLSNVVPHQKWSGKKCPHKLLPVWNNFISQINTFQVAQVDKGEGAMKMEIEDLKKKVASLEKKLNNNDPVSKWAAKDWEEVKDNGYFDSERPQAFISRQESAIVTNRVRRNFKALFEELDSRLKALEK